MVGHLDLASLWFHEGKACFKIGSMRAVMKLLGMISLILVTFTVAMADGNEPPRELRKDPRMGNQRPRANALKRKKSLAGSAFYASALYSTANQIRYKGQANIFGTTTDFTATEGTGGALGISGGYISRRANSWGYSADLSWEFPRSSSGLQGSAGTIDLSGNYAKSPSMSLIIAAFNGNYSIGSKSYVFAGLNYPLSTRQSGSLGGLPSFQLGGGFAFTRQIAIEGAYRSLKFKGSVESASLNLQVQESSFDGFVLGMRYEFR